MIWKAGDLTYPCEGEAVADVIPAVVWTLVEAFKTSYAREIEKGLRAVSGASYQDVEQESCRAVAGAILANFFATQPEGGALSNLIAARSEELIDAMLASYSSEEDPQDRPPLKLIK